MILRETDSLNVIYEKYFYINRCRQTEIEKLMLKTDI